MGMTLCESGGVHVSVSYDIQTVPQGIIFLCYAVVCALFEVVFLFFTLRFFCADHQSLVRTYLVMFYLSFHLSLLTSVLYFLGGFVCYGLTLYNAIANFSYLFQGIGVYAATMEILDSLLCMRELDGPPANFSTRWCSPVIVVHCVCFVSIFAVEISRHELRYFFLYNMVCHLILAAAFFTTSTNLFNEMSGKYPSIVSPENRSMWFGVAYTIMILMSVRALLAFLNYMGFTFYLKEHHVGMFTLYIIVFVTVFDLVPCAALTVFMQIQVSRGFRPKSVCGRLKSVEKMGFKATGDKNLMEEMVDCENADDDWA